ncbi:MFS transporter [Macrococcus hajekii]|uniref:MFS transporter n=1 Tax=Macrococcus hajekii TaxID=198482 RepID=A0A4R6BIG6_9STAP|nr:MFS transporter [Macrococcus hajekii]TDM01326.1 MFS transporter [Macrococcus hajekii]GGB10716.1 putative MFS-type transporter YfkF [Macrococcus hajekii]
MKNKQFVLILSAVVSISGFSQGMLLPLISFIFERDDVPSFINGLHATSLYIGVFLTSLFLEGLLRKWGFKPLIITGGAIVTLSFLLFPMLKTMTLWFILRLLVGIGDNMLHFATQSWLTQVTPRSQLGRALAYYGLSFSLGFMLGPLLVPLVNIHEALPFVVSAVMSLIAFTLVFTLKNSMPVQDTHPVSLSSTFINFRRVIKTSWIAFLFPMVFGVIESSINSNFPVFALKHDLTLHDITWILPSFSLGTILFQVPIGSLSDRGNRSHLLLVLTLIGATVFLMGDFFIAYRYVMIAVFFIAGIFVGSLYSLGVTYMTELTPKHLLPAGNLMCGMVFSIGSIAGPIIGGATIESSNNQLFFIAISSLILVTSIATLVFIMTNRQLRSD